MHRRDRHKHWIAWPPAVGIAGAWLWPTSRREGPEELALRPHLGVIRGPYP